METQNSQSPAPRPFVVPSLSRDEGGKAGILSSPLFVSLLFVVVLGLGIFLGKTFFSTSPKENSRISATPTVVVAPNTTEATSGASLANWKTYINQKYGFEFKYPENFFININSSDVNEIVKISDNRLFEKDEKALIINIVSLQNNQPTKIIGKEEQKLLEEKLGLSLLAQKLGNQATGIFFGNPPWGTYIVRIPGKIGDIEVSMRIHSGDELPLSEGGTNGKQIKIANQILSTFKFTK